MPHLGRTYPIFNPGRRLTPLDAWPRLPPTEINWVLGPWNGIDSVGLANTGRGMLPQPFTVPSDPLVYRLDLFNTFVVPIVVTYTLTLAAPPSQCKGNFQITCRGVPQLLSHDIPLGHTNYGDFGADINIAWNIAPGATVWPYDFCSFLPRLWVEPAPPPPPSRPY